MKRVQFPTHVSLRSKCNRSQGNDLPHILDVTVYACKWSDPSSYGFSCPSRSKQNPWSSSSNSSASRLLRDSEALSWRGRTYYIRFLTMLFSVCYQFSESKDHTQCTFPTLSLCAHHIEAWHPSLYLWSWICLLVLGVAAATPDLDMKCHIDSTVIVY